MLTPTQFYYRMLFGVLVDLNASVATGAVSVEPVWYPWKGKRVGHGMENGFITVWLDLGDRIIGARRTTRKTCKWLGPKPRQGDQMLMVLLLPEREI